MDNRKDISLIEYVHAFQRDIFTRVERNGKFISVPITDLTAIELLDHLLRWEQNERFRDELNNDDRKSDTSSIDN